MEHAHESYLCNDLMEYAPGMCSQGPQGMISAPFPRNALVECAHGMCSWHLLLACAHEFCSWNELMEYAHELLQPHSLGMRS